MEKFSLNKWLQDKSRKVIDDNGFPVEIIKWDANENYPVVLLDHNGIAYNVSVDGMYDSDPNHGLFFADEEKPNKILDELKSYLEKTPKEQIEKDWQEIRNCYNKYFADKSNEEERMNEFETRIYYLINFFDPDNYPSVKEVKEEAEILLDLARNVTYNPYKATVESIAKMVEKYEPYCKFDIDSNLTDFLNNVKIKCKDAMEYDKMFPQEEFVSKKQYEEDLDKAYKNADIVQFNRGMDEILNNPKRYFHVGDTIKLKNSNAEHTITSIFNGKYYGEGWNLDIIKAADDYELVEDCNEMKMTP